MSQRLSDSDGLQQDDIAEEDSFYIYGMYFCGVCRNLMTPYKDNGEKL